MLHFYQLYACPHEDIDVVAERVEKLLGVDLVARESIAWGDYFRVDDDEKDDVSVYPNESLEDGYAHEEEFADFPLLISIYDSTDPKRQKDLLENDPIVQAVEIKSEAELPKPE